jgi:carbamoyltransferase
MYILGIAGHHRDAAAALVKDGRILAAIEEEKLARIKNIGLNQCGGLPYEAIRYCLQSADIGIGAIDAVTYDHKPRRLLNRQRRFSEQFLPQRTPGRDDYEAASVNEYHDRMKTLNLVRRLVTESSKVIPVDHQLAHAASTFYLSGFERSAVVILSGRGDYISISAGIGEGRKIRLLKRIEFPHSLGYVYSQVTEYLGFDLRSGEHNTQWLSLNGEPEFLAGFQELIRLDAAGFPQVDASFFPQSFQGPDPFSEKFYARFGDALRQKDPRFDEGAKKPSWTQRIQELTGRAHTPIQENNYRRNMAHSIQQRLEQVVLSMIETIRAEYRVDSLCLAGGIALNSLLIARVERESGYRRLFVQPASGNSGCSVGSALFRWHHQLDQGRPEPLDHVFLGPEFSDHEVKPELDNCKLAYRYLPSEEKLLEEVVKLLVQGNIVAWFQGRTEFGPRSLGGRSILASPLLSYSKDNLNLFVKHREAYRPFAASVPEERAEEFFEHASPLSRFLLTTSRVKPEQRTVIPAAWFSNGLARVHTVNRNTNPLFWRLLNKFGEKTGVPVLVNTSFNLFQEPIVCTPREAVRSFYCSGIDALIINRFAIQK